VDDGTALTLNCLELAGHEEHDAYYGRLSTLVRHFRFEDVMTSFERLVVQGFAEYVASRYSLTPEGRERLQNCSPSHRTSYRGAP
jgi:hypothetical protein